MNYVYVRDGKILGSGHCRRLEEGTINIEASDEIVQDLDKYIFSEGELVLDPDYEERQAKKEKERIAKLSLTKREVFLALYKAKGLTPEMIRSQITDTEALIEFDYATEYFRFNPLIDKIGLMLGYSSEDIDYLFEHKQLPEKEEPEPIEESEVE